MKDNIMKNVPIFFEKNIGQYDKDVKFILRQNNIVTYFIKDEIVLSLNNDNSKILKIILEKSNKETNIEGFSELKAKMNYFKGSSEKDYIINIPLYEKVIYKEIYKGIDMLNYSNNGNLEYDFIINPNSNFEDIKLKFDGCDELKIDNDGNLEISIKEEIIKILKPKIHQKYKEQLINIEGKFALKEDNRVEFEVEQYDKEKALIIDPEIVYSTYVGGDLTDGGTGVVVDENQIAYITGYTYSISGFPIKNPPHVDSNVNAYILKIDTTLSGADSLLYGAYIGGGKTYHGAPGNTVSYSIDIDEDKNVYITGNTTCYYDFPIVNAYQETLNNYRLSCARNVFLTKINTTLSKILYSTYLGGTDS